METPWVVVGQTSVAANSSVDDPVPNGIAAINGCVTALPFDVPEGKILCLDSWGVEGYDAAGICVNVPWVESAAPFANPPYTSAYRLVRCLASCAADSGNSELLGCPVEIAAGARVHGRLINGTATTAVFGWYMKGRLVDVG